MLKQSSLTKIAFHQLKYVCEFIFFHSSLFANQD